MAKKSSVSHPQGKRRRVKQESIYLDDEGHAELRKLKDRPIDLNDPDAPEIEDFMVRERGKFYRPIKQQIRCAWTRTSSRGSRPAVTNTKPVSTMR